MSDPLNTELATATADKPDFADDAPLQDSIRVDVSRPGELKYWLDRFGVSQELLQTAVATVGTTAGDIATWLRIRR